MAKRNDNGVYECQFCGLTAPLGHARPRTWMEKHEMNCAKRT